MQRLLRVHLPGTILLGALVFAPWFWGCTWPFGVALLNLILLVATLCWAMGALLFPVSVPRTILFIVTLLLLQGWLMTFQARSICDPATGLFLSLSRPFPGFPGSIDQDSSFAAMVHFTGMLGAGLIAAELGACIVWRRFLFGTMTCTAVSIVLLGIAQRLGHATDIFWGPRHLDYFFATYRSVTNAGEYLTGVTPLAAALCLTAVVRRKSPAWIAPGCSLTALLLAGAWICGSKAAPLISVWTALVFVFLQWPFFGPRFAAVPRPVFALTLLLVVAAVGAMIFGIGLDTTAQRWNQWLAAGRGSDTFSNRMEVDRACLASLPEAGLLGFGPGTFPAIFPYYSGRSGGNLSGHWTFAHNDYLQTVMEWGWLGAGLWSAYLFGSFAQLGRGWRKKKWRTENHLHAGGLLAAQTGLFLMALGDYPLQIASIQLYAAMAIGLGWSSPAWECRRRKIKPSHSLPSTKIISPNFLALVRLFTTIHPKVS